MTNDSIYKLMRAILLLAFLSFSPHWARGQATPPMPPAVLVDGNVLTYVPINNDYETASYGTTGLSATLIFTSSYAFPYPFYFSTSDSSYTATGTYTNFMFTITGGMLVSTVQSADSAGVAWATTPTSGIPMIYVNDVPFTFAAADTTADYDYYVGPGGPQEEYLWVSPTAYGGYSSLLGQVSFSGTNHNGYFQDTSSTDMMLLPRNTGGVFLSLGSPSYGPPAIWHNGLTFQFMTTDTTVGQDVYYEDRTGYLFISSAGAVSGAASGTFNSSTTSFHNAINPPQANIAISLLGVSPVGWVFTPTWGPPAIKVNNVTWHYRGNTSLSTGQASTLSGSVDFYGGPNPGQSLSIAWNGTVSYTDKDLGYVDVAGFYNGGAFQNLPEPVVGATTSGGDWTSLSSSSSAPYSIIVDGEPWYYSTIVGGYVGPHTGQKIFITTTTATLTDPLNGIYSLSGTYSVTGTHTGVVTFPTSNIQVQVGNKNGTINNLPVTTTNFVGNLDISGNFTMGTLTSGGTTMNGFGLTFAGPSGGSAAQVVFGSTAAVADFIWSQATTSGGSQATGMKLNSTHVLSLYDSGGTVRTVLDPSNPSGFHAGLRTLPLGDIPMNYTSGTMP